MAKKESYTLFILGLLLISLVAIAINQPFSLSVPAVNLALDTPAEEVTNADQARWDAMGEFYAERAGLRPQKAFVADLARWDAKGEFYAEQAGIRLEKAFAADQARWDAIGEFYQNHGLVNDIR